MAAAAIIPMFGLPGGFGLGWRLAHTKLISASFGSRFSAVSRRVTSAVLVAAGLVIFFILFQAFGNR